MIRRAAMWLPALIAVIFLGVSGLVNLELVAQTREAVIANLLNTCENADVIRPTGAEECWKKYTEVSGEPRPATAGSTAP